MAVLSVVVTLAISSDKLGYAANTAIIPDGSTKSAIISAMLAAKPLLIHSAESPGLSKYRAAGPCAIIFARKFEFQFR